MAFLRAVAFSLLVILLASTAESAKECLECIRNGAACQSLAKTTCTRENATALVRMILPLFPNAQLHSPPSDKFSCLSMTYSVPVSIGNGDFEVVADFKGCVFETDGKLCQDHKEIVNGRLECLECTSDNCNGAMAMGGSLLVLVASCLLMRMYSSATQNKL